MKILILAAAALIATTLSAAADHEGSADSELANNDIFGGGLATQNRLTGSLAVKEVTDPTEKNDVAEGALGSHSPTAVLPDEECPGDIGICG
jgi:hypothetical protein